MTLKRREFLASAAAAIAAPVSMIALVQSGGAMYGLIGKMSAVMGKRDELVAILLESVGAMPGCLSYIVAKDSTDEQAIWITEVWDSKASHDASLTLPAVKAAIASGRPLIAAFGSGTVTTPVGGYGLPATGRTG
jgi:quinol monooxygenase YgiN